MESQNIYKAKNVDLNTLIFTKVKTNSRGGKQVYAYHKGGPFRVQTPKLTLPFGVTSNVGGKYYKEGDPVKYTIDFSLGGAEKGNSVDIFKEMLRELDNKLLDAAVENSIEWFNKEKKRVVLEDQYKKLLQPAIDKETKKETDKFPPRMRAKLTQDDKQNITTELYNKEGEVIVLDETNTIEDVLTKGSQVQAVLQNAGIYFMAGGAFGMTWRVVQMRVFPVKKKIEGYAFVEDSDDEGETETETNKGETEEVDLSGGEEVELSGDEQENNKEEVTQEPEPEPEPETKSEDPPKTTKKVTRKTTKKQKESMDNLLDDL